MACKFILTKYTTFSPFLSRLSRSTTSSSIPPTVKPTPPPPPTDSDRQVFSKLADLTEASFIETQSKIEASEYNTKNLYNYEISDENGQKLFEAVHFYETYPPRFEFKLYGPQGGLLVTHKLLQNLSSHLLSMQIIRPGGFYVGSIEERLDIRSDQPGIYELKDCRDEIQAIVLSDFSHSSYGYRRKLKIMTPDQSKVIGSMAKKWIGFDDKLDVWISFPPPSQMDAQFRTALLSLCVLLAFVHNFLLEPEIYSVNSIWGNVKQRYLEILLPKLSESRMN